MRLSAHPTEVFRVATHELRVEPSIVDASLAVAGPSTVLVDQMALFTISATPRLEGLPYEFRIDWDGDGRTDEIVDGVPGVQLQHVYTSAGHNNLTVSIEDANGNRTSATRAVEVFANNPELSVVGSPRVRVGEPALFDVAARAEGVIRGGESYELVVDWDGDETADESHDLGTNVTVTHVFDTPGKFAIGFRLNVETHNTWHVFEVTVLQRTARQPASLVASVDSGQDYSWDGLGVTSNDALVANSTWGGLGWRNLAFVGHEGTANDEEASRVPHSVQDLTAEEFEPRSQSGPE